jgi:tRNA A37 threonylcarbamoyladenosine modification protein TsaB
MILAFDTSAAHCAAALLSDGRILASASEGMTRGQAERLLPMLEQVLRSAGATWSDLEAIGVGIGPGNFTGIRLSVSAARGLSLSLNIPAFGIDSFAAIAFDHDHPVLAVVPAPRDQLYVKAPGTAGALIATGRAAGFDLPVETYDDPARLAANIACLAARAEGQNPPAPLYIRPADAAPSRIQPPQILENGA